MNYKGNLKKTVLEDFRLLIYLLICSFTVTVFVAHCVDITLDTGGLMTVGNILSVLKEFTIYSRAQYTFSVQDQLINILQAIRYLLQLPNSNPSSH